MKYIVLSFCLLFAVSLASAQKKDLMVRSSDAGLYLEHKVAPKESFYAIGRLYNVSPKYLANYNKLDLNKGLQIDQKLRIPLTDTNFIQQGNSGTPVYYKVGDKEGLMTVSNKNNKVTLASLRSWNDLSSDELKQDSKVVIGFLLSNAMPSVTLTAKPKQEEPVTVKAEEKPVVKEEKPVVKEEPNLTKDEKKAEEKEAEAELKGEKKIEKDAKEEKKNPEPVVVTEKPKPLITGEGYFKSHFEQQVRLNPVSKNETVTSGIFKTTSGWQDSKYYLLIDKVAPGTIVKVINPTNNKAVYAKVLGEMSGIRQNEGLNIRISNAAASELEIAEQDKFIVKVNY